DSAPLDDLRHLRLPCPLCRPEAVWSAAKQRADLLAEQCDLPLSVSVRDANEYRLVITATDDLHLIPLHHLAQKIDELRVKLLHPLKEVTTVVDVRPNRRNLREFL